MDEAEVPLAGIQLLVGHKTPHKTFRYQDRGPRNSYFVAGAAACEGQSRGGVMNATSRCFPCESRANDGVFRESAD